MASFLFTKLREFYTKAINYKMISTLEDSYTGNVMYDLDVKGFNTVPFGIHLSLNPFYL